MKNKDLLILHRINESLDIKEEGKEIVLEGIFAKFGVLNNNQRIYEEAEYLPHLQYLQEKISKRRLMGELDHPAQFEVALNRVSHIVESLTYDKEKREIRGRVRLLDTPTGNIAKTLVKAGVPISISSRAAGTVNEQKKVSIRKIFTYDLVYEPGFNEAVLEQINESFSFQDFDMSRKLDENLTSVNEQYGFDTLSGISLFEVKGDGDVEDTVIVEQTQTKMEEKNLDRAVLVKEMQNYSLKVKSEFERIDERLANIPAATDGDKIKSLEDKISKMHTFVNEMAVLLDSSIQYVEKVQEQASNAIDYAEKLATIINENAEALESVKNYSKTLATTINENAEAVENVKEYAEILAGIVNENSLVLEESMVNTNALTLEVKDLLDENKSFVDANLEIIKESFTNLTEYTETSLRESVSGESALRDEIYNTRNHLDSLSEKASELADFVDFKLNEGASSGTAPIISNSKVNYTNLSGSVDEILSSVKNTKIEENRTASKYNFLGVLNEAKQAEFLLLDETKKQKVANSINENSAKDQEAILESWNATLVQKSEPWLERAPEYYKALYEGVEDSIKLEIAKQANIWNPKDDNAIRNFWETRSQLLNAKPAESLNENATAELSPIEAYNLRIKNAFKGMQKFKS